MMPERDFLYAMCVGLFIGLLLGAVLMFSWLVGDPPRRQPPRP